MLDSDQSVARKRRRQKYRKTRRLAGDSVGFEEVAFMLFEELDTPVSLGAALRLQYGEWEQLVSMKCHPRHYLDTSIGAERFRRDYQAVSFLSKVKCELGLGTVAAASATWLAAEAQCAQANRKFSLLGDAAVPPHLQGYLARAREICHSIVGPFSWSEALELFGFGPGASLQVPARQATLSKKYSAEAVTSPPSTIVLSHVIGLTPSWFRALTGQELEGPACLLGVQGCDYDRGTFVHKNAKTKRSIAVGPNGGVYLQKGLGGIMRRRLRRWGIDLDDQRPNQRGAYLGSLDNSFATIDLASASDTVNIGVVRHLMPSDWFTALNSVRSRCVEFDEVGFKGPTSKFSAMGNGFTFELETTLFFSLALSVVRDKNLVKVYGDDIVVPTEHAQLVCELLEACGFKVNTEKSHLSGPFRESCGGDYFLGHDVTPLRFKSDSLRSLSSYYKMYNGIMRLPGGNRRILVRLYRSVNRRYRYLVPPSFGDDSGFKCPTAPRDLFTRHGWSVYRFHYWATIPRRIYTESEGLMPANLSRGVPSWIRREPLQVGYHSAVYRVVWEVPTQTPVGNGPSLRSDESTDRRRTAVGYTHSWS